MEQRLQYVVAVPIPFLDRLGKPLPARKRDRWVRLLLSELTMCFGGAIQIPAPGTNIVEGELLYEQGQTLVLAACRNRSEYLASKSRIKRLVLKMGAELNQSFVFVLAFPSDSFLIEIRDDLHGYQPQDRRK
jgi:hypothetical protein